MYTKTLGLVLREVEYKDADKLLTVLTRDRGKLTVRARGVRSRSSRLKSGCQLLAYSEFTLFENRNSLVADEALLSLTLNALAALSRPDPDSRKIKAAFEFRAACIAGYTPMLEGCVSCGSENPDRFHVSGGFLSCAACPGDDTGLRLPLSPGSLAALRYLASCPPKRVFAFQIGESAQKELSDIAETYLLTQLERGFFTLDFYKSLLLQIP